MMTGSNFQTNLIDMQKNMFNFAMMLTADHDNAYDLVQDTTMRALDTQDTFVEGTSFKNWVFTIMRNIYVANYRRTAYSAAKIDTTDSLYSVSIASTFTSEVPEGSFSTIEMTNMIGQLPAELSKPFALFAAGYTYNDIASKLGMSVNTVKANVADARKRINAAC